MLVNSLTNFLGLFEGQESSHPRNGYPSFTLRITGQ